MVRKRSWLIFNWGYNEDLSLYKAIATGNAPAASLEDGLKKEFQVTLSSKYEKSPLYNGSGCNNHMIKIFPYRKKEDAIKYGKEIAENLNLEFIDAIK